MMSIKGSEEGRCKGGTWKGNKTNDGNQVGLVRERRLRWILFWVLRGGKSGEVSVE